MEAGVVSDLFACDTELLSVNLDDFAAVIMLATVLAVNTNRKRVLVRHHSEPSERDLSLAAKRRLRRI
jgi:hypothetical protein